MGGSDRLWLDKPRAYVAVIDAQKVCMGATATIQVSIPAEQAMRRVFRVISSCLIGPKRLPSQRVLPMALIETDRSLASAVLATPVTDRLTRDIHGPEKVRLSPSTTSESERDDSQLEPDEWLHLDL